MKVLSIGLDFTAFSGEQRGDLINRLKKYANDKRVEKVYQICYTPNKGYKPIKIGKKIMLIPTNSPAKLLFPVDCKILSKNLDFDLITCQDVESCGMAGMLIKISSGKPLVCNFFTIKPKGWFLSKIEKIVLKACNLVRVESQTQKEMLIKSGYNKPIIIAPIGFDLNKFKPPKKRKANNTVLYVGRLSPEKNVEMLLKAASYLPHVWFDIIGDGVERNRLEKMKTSNVKFFGNIPHDRLRNCYNNSNVLVLTSKYEGIPTCIIEGMSNSLPVITTDFPDAHDIVDDGVTGYIIPQDSVGRLRDCITILMLQPNMRERMGQAGYNKVHKEYSEMMINKVVDGWKSVLK